MNNDPGSKISLDIESGLSIPYPLKFQNATRKQLLIKINDFSVLPIQPFGFYPEVLVSSVHTQILVINSLMGEAVFIGEFSYENGPTQFCHPYIAETSMLGETGQDYYKFYYYLTSIGTITEFGKVSKEIWDSAPGLTL